MHGHRPSAAAARDVAEGGEGGRPHRCFPLPPGMPLRSLSTARAQELPRRPREAPTCRDRRMVHVESTGVQLSECSGEGGNGREVGTSCMRVHTGMQGGPGLPHSAPPMLLSVPRASCDTARHMRSMCGVLRDGAAGRLGQRQHDCNAEMPPLPRAAHVAYAVLILGGLG